MKTIVGTLFLVLLFLSSCRKNPGNHWENTLLQFYETSDSDFCHAVQRRTSGCTKGRMILTSEGKALYYYNCRRNDSATFYRGTYTVQDSTIECLFDSRLTASKEKKGKKGAFSSTQRKKIRLHITGCEAGRAWMYSRDLTDDGDSGRVNTVFRKADLFTYSDFCQLTSDFPALVDFKCRPGSDTSYQNAQTLDQSVLNMMVDHYKGKNPKSRMIRNDNDSAVHLSFSYLKRRRGDDGQPYLYVTIPKTRKKSLTGDLNGDAVADLVVLPRLSQGGNSYWNDLYVLLYLKGNFNPAAVVSAMDLARCTRNSYNGSFSPREISNGLIKGTNTCYTDDDSHCCPSVKLEASYKLDNKKLKFVPVKKKK